MIADCHVWDESQAKREVNEIATCVLKYIEEIARKRPQLDIILYSDNCAGQQKISVWLLSTYTSNKRLISLH